MSFFDNNKTVGLVLIIIGLIMFVGGLVSAVAWLADDTLNTGAQIAFGIGGIIGGLLWLFYGMKVRSGSNDKVAIVSGLVRTIGVITILIAIFVAAGNYLANDEFGLGAALVSLIVSIIIGLIYLWISGKIAGKNKNVISKIVWVLLVIISLIMVVVHILGIFDADIWGIISHICWAVAYIYVFLASLSPEVKSSMGI
ncbi:MAG: hypothetical protein FWG41_04735 [Methanomassiliicoccaceae archaeon]|nr:hypothetical protein [Methanomassiliicoccaceae archaeon]